MKIKVENYSMYPSRFIAGTKGSYGFDFLDIEFGEGWDGLSKKIVFSPADAPAVSVLYQGSPVVIPAEVMSCRGKSGFAVVGYQNSNKRITVTGEIEVLGTLDDSDAQNATVPTPSEIAQCLGYLEEARSIASSVRSDADVGAFDGNGWHIGIAVRGTSGAIKAFVDGAQKGDLYLNISTGNVYIAVENGVWSYKGSIKGNVGDAAGFGAVSASVEYDADVSEPEVSVTSSGADRAKSFDFKFRFPCYPITVDVADLEAAIAEVLV